MTIRIYNLAGGANEFESLGVAEHGLMQVVDELTPALGHLHGKEAV